MPSEANIQSRRSHRKSRHGCKECKRRHIKCDEHRPSCINCVTVRRPCSFLQLHSQLSQTEALCRDDMTSQSFATATISGSDPTPPTGSTPSVTKSAPSTIETPSVTLSTPSAIDTPCFTDTSSAAGPPSLIANHGESSLRPLPSQGFTMGHLMFLHHLEREIMESPSHWGLADEKGATLCYEAVFRAAIATPYLMDQMLALSALHLSTLSLDGAQRAEYLREASKLQIRALGNFTATDTEVTEDNALAMIVFSSFISLQSLFEAKACQDDFAGFLTKIMRHLSLHRGVQAVSSDAWGFLRQTGIKHIIHAIEAGDGDGSQAADTANECDHVQRLLESSRDQLGSQTYDACSAALSVLRWVFRTRKALPEPYPTHITLAWPVRITPEFMSLLEQRQPVSLIILAYWAMLLHADRHFWVFGDAGRFMIESLVNYLGDYWEDWLVVPKTAIGAA